MSQWGAQCSGVFVPSNQVFCGSIESLYFCSVVWAEHSYWNREGESGAIWVFNIGSTSSIPYSILCWPICVCMSPAGLWVTLWSHFQGEDLLLTANRSPFAPSPGHLVWSSGGLFWFPDSWKELFFLRRFFCCVVLPYFCYIFRDLLRFIIYACIYS